MGVHFNYNKDIYYRMVPRIFPVGEATEIAVYDAYGARELPETIILQIIPTMVFNKSTLGDEITVEVKDGGFSFTYAFAKEQEYLIRLLNTDKEKLYIEFSVYALESDLFDRCPLKCDLHMHTNMSDGTETPKHRLAMARQCGLDCLAVTDHNVYAASLVTIEELAKVPSRMIAMRGEEVHVGALWFQDALSTVHVLSLDADYAIAPFKAFVTEEEYFERRAELEHAFDEQVEKYPWLATMGKQCALETLAATKARREQLADQWEGKVGDIDLDIFVYTLDVFEEISRAGGMSVLCHPLWRLVWDMALERRIDISVDLAQKLIEVKPFDACEVASYADQDENARNFMQEKLLQEAGLWGNTPVLGITDSHTTMDGLNILGDVYTIAFSKDRSVRGVRNAISDLYSVAVDDYPGEDARCHGSFRLSCYAEFLIDRFFPVHDANAHIEGQLMMKFFETGDNMLPPMLAKLCEMHEVEEKAWWAPSPTIL